MNIKLITSIIVLTIFTAGCTSTANPDASTAPAEETQTTSDSEFTLTDDAENVVSSEGSVNFKTGLTLEEALKMYREEFTGKGRTERELLTVESETTFSIVFDGSEGEKAIVVQGVELDAESTNINIRYEEI